MYTVYHHTDWHRQIAERLVAFLNDRGIDAESKLVDTIDPDGNGEKPTGMVVTVIRSDGRFWAIDFKDTMNPKRNYVVREWIMSPKCVSVLKAQYRMNYYTQEVYDKLNPYTYFEKDPARFQRERNMFTGVERTERSLYFRGQPWGFRVKVLRHLDDVLVPQRKKKLRMSLYFDECAKYKVGLALPGFGNACHREIEYMGMGIPVIMPVLKTSFHDPLIPGVHYFGVPVNTSDSNSEEIADKIRQKYLEIIDDDDKLAKVAHNATEWYERNVLFPNSIELTARIMGII